MRRKLLVACCFVFFGWTTLQLLLPKETNSWGFFAHRKINHYAVFTLPTELIGFYKIHIDYITKNSTKPDERRYAVVYEAPRHYIDIDHYGEHPFDSVPKRWFDAVNKYSEDTLQAYGIVPWHIEVMQKRLTKAFEQKDLDAILKNSAEIGHYIADAHVPLHTTENYNGQLTNQKGIHGFWESRIPELFFDEYDLLVGAAEYIEKPLDVAWKTVKESHAAVDSVFQFEIDATNQLGEQNKWEFTRRGNVTVKTYSYDFSMLYSNMLSGQVERRLRSAIHTIGSFWYTAWVNAGKPVLPGVQIVVQPTQDDTLKPNVKIFGREHE